MTKCPFDLKKVSFRGPTNILLKTRQAPILIQLYTCLKDKKIITDAEIVRPLQII